MNNSFKPKKLIPSKTHEDATVKNRQITRFMGTLSKEQTSHNKQVNTKEDQVKQPNTGNKFCVS